MYIIRLSFNTLMRYHVGMYMHTLFGLCFLFFVPVVAYAQGITPYLQTFAAFINDILLPFLFAVAFIFFLFNITRYFIVEGASEEGRDKAKRNAIWGIAAFVFLLSLWTITSLLLSSLNISREDAYCPDYLEEFGFSGTCNDRDGSISGTSGFIESSGGTSGSSYSGRTTSGPTPTTRTSVSGSTDDSTRSGSTTSAPVTTAPLAELVLGTGRDITTLDNSVSAQLAESSTPAVDSTASCTTAITLLQQAAKKESSQAGYVYARGLNDSWQNITTTHSATRISYHVPTLRTFIEEHDKDEVHLFHIHPSSRNESLGLISTGAGPTRSDFSLLCELDRSITHHIVDENGVWTYQAGNSTCPIIDASNLSIAETYLALSTLKATTRQEELQKYISDDLTGTTYDEHFSPVLALDINKMSGTQIREMAQTILDKLDLSVTYNSVDTFCAR